MSEKTADKRTTVSLAWVVWEMAQQMMQARGFNDNFSAYVADLVRRDRDRHKDQERAEREWAEAHPPKLPRHVPSARKKAT